MRPTSANSALKLQASGLDRCSLAFRHERAGGGRGHRTELRLALALVLAHAIDCRGRSRWTTVDCPLGSALGAVYTAVPNIAPTPAVTAMANVPQNATRSALFKGGVPPTAAAAAPSMARKTIAVATTQ